MPARRSNTVRANNQDRAELKFHSLRVYKRPKATSVERIAKIRSTTAASVANMTWTCPEHTPPTPVAPHEGVEKTNNEVNAEKEKSCEALNKSCESPLVPDRKMKPKFLQYLKSRKKVEDGDDGDWCGLNDDASLLSGVQRLSWSPAPTPAPRKSVPSATRSSPNKHTYQNVPIPISPNNSQTSSDAQPTQEVSIFAIFLD